MTQGTVARILAVTMVAAAALACGPRKTPEQRLETMRQAHEIVPLGANTVHDSTGEPSLIVDLQVTNHGADKLNHLTVMVRVRGADGAEKAARRVTLDLSSIRPGVGTQIAATLPGVALTDDDEVTVELESGLPADVLHTLPEWADVSGPG